MSNTSESDPSDVEDAADALVRGLARCRDLVADLELKLKAPRLDGSSPGADDTPMPSR